MVSLPSGGGTFFCFAVVGGSHKKIEMEFEIEAKFTVIPNN
jgi:hypothetical protein